MKPKKALWDTRLKRVIGDAIADFQPVAQTGVAVAVLQNGGIAFSGGFGWRDRQSRKKVTARTVFPIGSATKAFNSMVLAIHAAPPHGNFTLDMPVTDYAPDFAMQQAKPTTDMTLVDMLSHQTGLPRNDALWYLGPFSRCQLYFRLRGLAQINGAFRTAFLYNNLMYMTAGHLLEYLTGSAWE
ncbi:MAG TPA: serine hydrolase domain-containing protein, partial [Stellaceae bacterium]|nr:serine hydrolase domain-containing protein [Stellaceae bacterium]